MKYRISPSKVACFIEVICPATNERWDCFYYSKECGVVVGLSEKPIELSDLPLVVRAEINKHFAHVFSLDYENHSDPINTPRAKYVDSLVPWEIEVDDENQNK